MKPSLKKVCSACYMYRQGDEYIDFETTWEGPMVVEEFHGVEIPAPEPGHLDDLILCESCLRLAGRMIGMGDVQETQVELEQLRTEVLELRKSRIDAERRLEGIESALDGRFRAEPRKRASAPRKASKSNA